MRQTREFAIILLLAFLFIAMSQPASALTNTSWTSDSDWTSGTLTDMDTHTSNPCVQTGGIEMNWTKGVSYPSTNCPQSSPWISSQNLTVSVSGNPILTSPLLYGDYGPGKQPANPGGPVSIVNGPISDNKAIYFGTAAGGSALRVGYTGSGGNPVEADWALGTSLNRFTIATWLYFNATTCATSVCVIVYDNAQSACTTGVGYIWTYGAISGSTWNLVVQWCGNNVGRSAITLTNLPKSTWIPIVERYDYTNATSVHSTTTQSVLTTLTSPPLRVPVSSARTLLVGGDGSRLLGNTFRGSIAMFSVWTRWLTNGEVSAYLSLATLKQSGSWKSPAFNGTSNEIPYAIGIDSVGTGSITSVSILDSDTGFVLSSWVTQHNVGPMRLLITNPSLMGSGPWKLLLEVTGNGLTTPQIEEIAVQFATLTVAIPSHWLVLLAFLWVLFVLLLAVGLWKSPVFLILAGLLGIILTLAVDTILMEEQNNLTRYGTFIVLIVMSILIFTQGALHLPDEFSKEVKR